MCGIITVFITVTKLLPVPTTDCYVLYREQQPFITFILHTKQNEILFGLRTAHLTIFSHAKNIRIRYGKNPKFICVQHDTCTFICCNGSNKHFQNAYHSELYSRLDEINHHFASCLLYANFV